MLTWCNQTIAAAGDAASNAVVVVVADGGGDDGVHDAAVLDRLQGCFDDTSRSVVDGKNDSHMRCIPCEMPIRRCSCSLRRKWTPSQGYFRRPRWFAWWARNPPCTRWWLTRLAKTTEA